MSAPESTTPDLIVGAFGAYRLGDHAGIFLALAALPVAWAGHWLGGFPLLAALTAILAAGIVWARPRAAAPLVSDRIVGQWLALWPLSGGLWAAGAAPHVFPWPGWVGGFLVCQFLLLIPAVRRLEGLRDDLVSGGGAAAIVLVAAAISHGWLA